MKSELLQRIISIRRELHQFPELSWEEKHTAERIEKFLTDYQIPFRRVASTGIIADLPGDTRQPILALRADIDALPIFEETGLPFASQTDGVMHACGHDGHTSILLGAAYQATTEKKLPAPVRLIFQPAEEVGQGARAMIEAGALEGVGMIFGGHIDRHYPTGKIVVSEGAVNASSDKFEISIEGSGGHAARPHEAVDAVVVGSLLVISLQTIVSRGVNPAHPSVVTVGRFDAGTASNVIAGRASIQGSIRAQDEKVREYLHRSIERMAHSVAQLHGARIDVQIHRGTPAVFNRGIPLEIARQAATHVVGAENVIGMESANMGGEDFGYYLEKVPGCYVRFGAAKKDEETYPAHSSRFDFDESVLGIAADYYTQLACNFSLASNSERPE